MKTPVLQDHLGEALRSALEVSVNPAMASADWLARDIDPDRPSAVALLTDRKVPLDDIQKAKSTYKTMRIVGETGADRRVGARLYAAAIAAGLVYHGRRISRQSDRALRRGLQSLLEDGLMPEGLRTLAGQALGMLNGRKPSV
jgi:hypothetical protein